MPTLREDLAASGQLRFRVHGDSLRLFKAKGESVHQIYLKVLTYALYAERFDSLEIDPRVDCKYAPHVAHLDLTGDVQFWAHCGDVSMEQVAYILKHSDAEEVVLVREDERSNLDDYVAYVKRHIHYRYTTGRLRLLSFQPLEAWFDPDSVRVSPDDYTLYAF